MAVDTGESTGKLVFEAKHVSKVVRRRAGHPRLLAAHPARRSRRPDRSNGSGKTTLLRMLVGELEPDAGDDSARRRLQVAYFDQQREQLDPDARSPTQSTTATTPS